jgi:hypothetical protein
MKFFSQTSKEKVGKEMKKMRKKGKKTYSYAKDRKFKSQRVKETTGKLTKEQHTKLPLSQIKR